jgi:hypothetical protein
MGILIYDIRPSPIHGRGVFTEVGIKTGSEYSFPVVLYSWDSVPNSLKPYTFPWAIDPRTKQKIYCTVAVGSFMNHASSPNMVASNNTSERHMKFTALRDIAAGEELTLYYGKWADKKFLTPEKLCA